MRTDLWTPVEDEILRQHYIKLGPSKLWDLLPARSKHGIRKRAELLGLTGCITRGPRKQPIRLRLADQDFKRLKASIPPDTRDNTGRLCGDPLPGRSSLDRKRAQGDAR